MRTFYLFLYGFIFTVLTIAIFFIGCGGSGSGGGGKDSRYDERQVSFTVNCSGVQCNNPSEEKLVTISLQYSPYTVLGQKKTCRWYCGSGYKGTRKDDVTISFDNYTYNKGCWTIVYEDLGNPGIAPYSGLCNN